MHELMDILEGYDRLGNTGYIWICACGKRGKGSKRHADARAAYKRHRHNDTTSSRAPRNQTHKQSVKNMDFTPSPSRDW